MNLPPLYSIGHGNRSIEDFIRLLKKFQIEFLIDVRSRPYSKLFPGFNRNQLLQTLKSHHITYVFMGDLLGGLPHDHSTLNEQNKVDYEILKTRPYFKQGISRLETAYHKGIRAALMCSESDPCMCHRSKLIGCALSDLNIPLLHIDENGKIQTQNDVMLKVNKGLSPIDLFGNTNHYTSRKTNNNQ
jgi:uncharacterized protein (DUF488 family)